ncbi:DUF1176 domain-containing protein [Pararhizobium sp.]|uniref:DUF1176 domain-containing protein n=1 Tax=Pararhizobium sp. TaxID=1977563 RepID=UPI00271A1127|nr:DUF1176 domain-containing protein [Pararhizobium sp.]MDO9418966.1 DUF1176 domain-containing protein [Pararhizobium sp.]
MPRFHPAVFAAVSVLAASSPAPAQDAAGIKAAETYAKAVLGEQCDMNSMTEISVNPPEPEGLSHYSYEIGFRYSYMGADEPEQKAELYQIFCSSGAYNISHAFILKTTDPAGLQLVSFPQPVMKFDYADAEQTSLKSPPRVTGYAGRSTLVNASYDPQTRTITSRAAWRGIGDAWDSGQWVFEDGSFVLKKFDVDPTYNGGETEESETPESYVVFQAP